MARAEGTFEIASAATCRAVARGWLDHEPG
jgi:hypothetical protein